MGSHKVTTPWSAGDGAAGQLRIPVTYVNLILRSLDRATAAAVLRQSGLAPADLAAGEALVTLPQMRVLSASLVQALQSFPRQALHAAALSLQISCCQRLHIAAMTDDISALPGGSGPTAAKARFDNPQVNVDIGPMNIQGFQPLSCQRQQFFK